MMGAVWVLVLMINGVALDISRPMDYYQCQNAMVRYMREHPERREIVRCEYRYNTPVNKG